MYGGYAKSLALLPQCLLQAISDKIPVLTNILSDSVIKLRGFLTRIVYLLYTLSENFKVIICKSIFRYSRIVPVSERTSVYNKFCSEMGTEFDVREGVC